MKKLFVVFLFFAMFFFAPLVEANGWLSGYYNRIKIPIDASKVDAALSNFPVLVKLTSANFDFSKANSDGYDFRFTSDDGTTLLKYERERHDSANSLAEYWIKVPSVSASADTYIYLYYRAVDTADGADPENVWDSNFKAVHHLKDNTTSSVLDSTSNNNDGTKKAANEPVEIAGKIAKGQDFDGTNDHILLADSASLKPTTAITVDMWFKADSFSNFRSLIVNSDDAGSWQSGYGICFYLDATQKIRFWLNVWAASSMIAADFNDTTNWHHLVAVYDKSEMAIYIDGIKSASKEYTSDIGYSTTVGTRIGSYAPSDGGTVDAKIDEVRISNVARSAAWIKASYHAGAGSLLKSFVNESLYGNFFLMF